MVFHNGVTDAEYDELLLRATALTSLSRAEGYGLPLVEAMALGTPVIASDIPIFREVGGDAVSYVHPESPAEFAAAVTALGEDISLAGALPNIGGTRRHTSTGTNRHGSSWPRPKRSLHSVNGRRNPAHGQGQRTSTPSKRNCTGPDVRLAALATFTARMARVVSAASA